MKQNTKFWGAHLVVLILGVMIIATTLAMADNTLVPLYATDCSSKAVYRAMVASDGHLDQTRIVKGVGKLRDGHTPGHVESQAWLVDRWYYLYDAWNGDIVAVDQCPEGFKPLLYIDTKKYIESNYFDKKLP